MAASDQEVVLEVVKSGLLQALDKKYLGPKKSIYCYMPEAGGCPAREFLNGLPREAQASYATALQRRCAGHTIRGDKHHLWTQKGCDGVYAFKDNPTKTRLVHITDVNNTDILLFGFSGKNEDKVDQYHVNRAVRLRDEYRRRRGEIEKRMLNGEKRGR